MLNHSTAFPTAGHAYLHRAAKAGAIDLLVLLQACIDAGVTALRQFGRGDRLSLAEDGAGAALYHFLQQHAVVFRIATAATAEPPLSDSGRLLVFAKQPLRGRPQSEPPIARCTNSRAGQYCTIFNAFGLAGAGPTLGRLATSADCALSDRLSAEAGFDPPSPAPDTAAGGDERAVWQCKEDSADSDASFVRMLALHTLEHSPEAVTPADLASLLVSRDTMAASVSLQRKMPLLCCLTSAHHADRLSSA